MHTNLLAIPLVLAAAATAQDLIGISFAGDVSILDSHTGNGQLLAGNAMRCNSMARKDANLWVDVAVGPVGFATRGLGTLDEHTGVITNVFPNLGLDIRGLATTGTFNRLMAVVNDTPSDRLVQINLTNGTATTIGFTGFSNIQALTLSLGQFYAWDTTAGLLRVDFLTGVATDVDPQLGTGGADIQFLSVMHDGRMLGGRNQLFEVDPATGVATLIGGSGYTDLRGADERFGYFQSYGIACHGAGGIATLTVSGSTSVPTTLVTRSINHAANAPGFMCMGFSDTRAGALALPFDVDPILGTHGCRVLQSCDITLFGTANALGNLNVPLALPPLVRGAFFYFQHAALEPVQGGWSFSNGVLASLDL